MLGGNLPENRELEKRLFSNEEVLAVNQQGYSPFQLSKNDSSMIWMSFAPGVKELYIAIFNIGDHASNIGFSFKSLKLKGKLHVRDLWKKADLGIFKDQFSQRINAHGCVLLKVSTNKPYFESKATLVGTTFTLEKPISMH